MSKDKYKVGNWNEYNEGLKQRGAIKIWIDTAIELCLLVRKVYHLPLRQTEGFVESFFAQMHLDLPVPCYTQMRRPRLSCSAIR